MSAQHSSESDVPVTGTQFGKWTVVGVSGSMDCRSEPMIVCVCSCGVKRRVSRRSLWRGISAGCKACVRLVRDAKMIGSRFGKRTVIERAPGQRTADYWRCRCDCGKISIVDGPSLRYGACHSCIGCRKYAYGHVKYDLTGRQFGMWTIVAFEGHAVSRTRMWRCRCACGFEAVRPSGYFSSITIGGCRKCKAKRMLRQAESRVWHGIKASASHRGYDFCLNREETFKMLPTQHYRCALTGLPISIALGARDHSHGGSTASLDRIDNTMGYVSGNVWWVHKDVNRMKWTLSLERFLEICRLTSEKFPEAAGKGSI